MSVGTSTDSARYVILDKSTTGENGILFKNAGNNKGKILLDSSEDMQFYVNSTTNAMTIKESGNVGIGTAAPDDLLHVYAGNSGATPHSLSAFNIESASNVAMNFLTPNTSEAQIRWADPQDDGKGIVGYNHNGDYMYFATNGPEKMRLNADGNLGVGITTIEQLGSDSVYPRIQSYSSATSGHFCGLMIGRPNSPGLENSIAFTVGGIMVGKIQHDYVASNHNDMSFHLRLATGGVDQEVARYWAGSGSEYAYLIGTTDATLSGTDSGFVFKNDGNSSFVTGTGIMYMRRTSSNGTHIKFRSTSNATVGQIDSDGSNTSYVTSSDYRLKENISYDFDALTRVQQLKPARFNFIANPDVTQDGFIAHEVQDIVPVAVSGIKDAVDEEGNIEPQGVDHSKLVPLLTKAIQEQQTIIEDLRTRIETLENA